MNGILCHSPMEPASQARRSAPSCIVDDDDDDIANRPCGADKGPGDVLQGELRIVRHPAQVEGLARNRDLEGLYRQYHVQVRGYAMRTFSLSASAADDVVQAVFERYECRSAGRIIDNPGGFLIVMTRNLVLDRRRRWSVRARYAAEMLAGDNEADGLDAERIVISRQQLSLVEEAIATLDLRSREILLLSRVEGLSSAEIARRKACSPTLVKRIIANALARCRQAIEGGRLPGPIIKDALASASKGMAKCKAK